jgi:hypothetical protein
VADHNVTAAQIGAYAKTLAASTVDTVRLRVDDDHPPSDRIEVFSNGSAEIYFTVDGSPPTVGGAGTYFLPAAMSSRDVEWPGGGDDDAVVKLISSGTPTYSVARGD